MLELVIVITLIALLVALALPPTLRARVQANESAAIGNLRTLSSASESFRTTLNPPAYPPNLGAMISSNPSYLDTSWSANQRQGYNFSYTVAGDQSAYSVVASPQISGISGVNSYCVDQTGVLRRYSAGAGTVGTQAGCDAGGAPI